MSFATDVNLLIYAINQDAEHHAKAKNFVEEKACGSETWAIPWPVLHSFLRISTHSGILPSPLSPAQAISEIEQLLSLPHVQCLSEEGQRFWDTYQKDIRALHARGSMVSDVVIASILKAHGVRTIYTADKDFLRFDWLRVINPLA